MNHINHEQYLSEPVTPEVTQEAIDALLDQSDNPSHLVATMQRERANAEWVMVNVLAGLDNGEELDVDDADRMLDTAGYAYDVLESRALAVPHNHDTDLSVNKEE